MSLACDHFCCIGKSAAAAAGKSKNEILHLNRKHCGCNKVSSFNATFNWGRTIYIFSMRSTYSQKYRSINNSLHEGTVCPCYYSIFTPTPPSKIFILSKKHLKLFNYKFAIVFVFIVQSGTCLSSI